MISEPDLARMIAIAVRIAAVGAPPQIDSTSAGRKAERDAARLAMGLFADRDIAYLHGRVVELLAIVQELSNQRCLVDPAVGLAYLWRGEGCQQCLPCRARLVPGTVEEVA